MADQAAHVVNRVLIIPMPCRPWVLTLPWTLRRHGAFDADLVTAITTMAPEVILGWLRDPEKGFGVPIRYPPAHRLAVAAAAARRAAACRAVARVEAFGKTEPG